MVKLFKILGGLLLAVVVLVLVAVIVIPLVVDPNDYKGEIVAQVEQHTGRELTISGDLNLSIFPWLGLEMGGMTLSNAQGFGDQSFAAVEQAAVRVKIMPLLSKRVEIDTIILDGLVVNLAKNREGVTNWDDLVKGGAPQPQEQAEQTKPRSSSDDGRGTPLAAFTIGGIDINNARISWDDKSSGQQYVISPLNLRTGAIESGKPVDLELTVGMTSSAPKAKADLSLKGRVNLDQVAGQLTVDGLALRLSAEGEDLPGGKIDASLDSNLMLTLDGQSADVNNLLLTLGDLKLSGSIQARQLASAPQVSGSLQLAEFNLRQWAASIGQELPPTADPKVLTRVGAKLVLKASEGVTRLENLQLTLDDSTLTGSASIKGPAIGFNLKLDAIDADRYLPPESEKPAAKKEGSGSKGDAKGAKEPELLPVEMLRKLDINGQIAVGKLIIKKLKAADILLKVKAKGGNITVDQQVGKFYDGAFKGKVKLDVRGKQPLIGITSDLSGLQAGPLLKDLTGKDQLSGKGLFKADIKTSGNTLTSFKRNLGGKLNFLFDDGAVKGVNVAQMLREAKARMKGESLPKTDQPAQTDFSVMSGSATIKKGLLTNKDLLAKSPYLRVNGNGTVNLVSERLDYLIKPVVVSTAKGKGGEGLDDLKGIPVPIKVSGSFSDPSYSLDMEALLKETGKAKIEEQKEELKGKAQDKLQDALRGLFK